MRISKLSRVDKAATLLLSLGEQIAAEIIKQMSPHELTRLTQAMSRLGAVDQDIANKVSEEFLELLQMPKRTLHGDILGTKRLLSKAGRHAEAAALENTLEAQSRELFDQIAAIDTDSLSRWLRAEAPQVIAVALAHMKGAQAAAVVKGFSAKDQAEIFLRLAQLGPVDRDSLAALTDSLAKLQQSSQGASQLTLGGVNNLVELINALAPRQREEQLLLITERDPNLAADIRRRLFTFADLRRISDRGMQTLLAQVPATVLRMALKSADEAISQHIYKNLSERAAKLLRDDIAAMPKTRLTEVEAAQQQIAELAQSLAADGKIEIMSADEAYV